MLIIIISKNGILIGDLLSAHYYTLLAEINDLSYQLSMSEAIVKVNELKSSLHQQTLSEYEISEAIIDIEVLFLILRLLILERKLISTLYSMN